VLSDALKSRLREIVNDNETFDFVRSSRDSRSGVITMEIEFDELISKLLPAAMDGAVALLAELSGVSDAWREDVELIVIEGDLDMKHIDACLRSYWRGVSAALA